jgi:inosine/xanthosine triphosphate pyrophosphatase family protein
VMPRRTGRRMVISAMEDAAQPTRTGQTAQSFSSLLAGGVAALCDLLLFGPDSGLAQFALTGFVGARAKPDGMR